MVPGEHDPFVALGELLRAGREFAPHRVCLSSAGVARQVAAVHAAGRTLGSPDALTSAAVYIDTATDRAVLRDISDRDDPPQADNSPDAERTLRTGLPARTGESGHGEVSSTGDESLDARAGDGHGQHSRSADLYALGALMYEMCCGNPPSAVAESSAHPKSDGGEQRRSAVFGQPVRPEGIPEPLWCVIESLLDPEPAHRPVSADEVAAQLSVLAVTLADEQPATRVLEEERIYCFSADDDDVEPRRPLRLLRLSVTRSRHVPSAVPGEPKPRAVQARHALPAATRPMPRTPQAQAASRTAGHTTRAATSPAFHPSRGPRLVGAVAGLTLLGVASFAITWFVNTSIQDASTPVRVQVEAPKSTSESAQTIEPAVGVGVYEGPGMAGRNAARAP